MDRNLHGRSGHNINRESLSARRAWIEITATLPSIAGYLSLSARRAWIEINTRNQPGKPKAVALRKESVDRNDTVEIIIVKMYVALRKESVDRNNGRFRAVQNTQMSLSARRAWIEIHTCQYFFSNF